MPRKIVPVPGVPPHQWHKHQPPAVDDEDLNDNMAPHKYSIDSQTESISRHSSEVSAEPETKKVSIKQWMTTTDDPARLRRLMPGGQYEAPRAAPKIGAGEYGGRLPYPHEVVAPVESDLLQDMYRETHQHFKGASALKSQPFKAYNEPEKRISGTVQSQSVTPSESASAWRDFAANPEPTKQVPQLQKTAGSRKMQHGGATVIMHDRPQEQPEDEMSVQSDKTLPATKPAEVVKNEEAPAQTSKSPSPTDRRHYTNEDPSPSAGRRQDDDTPPPVGRRQYGANPVSLAAYPQAERQRHPALSSNESGSVAPEPVRSPDIRNVRIPRPNRDYCASVRSMVSVLSLDEKDNARGDRFNDRSPEKHSDIRSRIGLEHNLKMSGGKLINTDIWAEKPRAPDGAFLDPVYANPWIEDYVEHQTDYDHDYTVPDFMNSECMHRQMTSTASLYVKRKAIKNIKNDEPGPPPRPPRGWIESTTPLAPTSPERPTQQKQSQPVAPPKEESGPHYDPFTPRMPCHARPATLDDMEGVRGIYAWEVLNGIQALDTEPLSLQEWESILNKTQAEKLPFVVVIGGSYGKFLGRDGSGPSNQEIAGKVLAFGFLAVRQPGLSGSFNGTSRMSAKAHVFVHPDHRRKKLGHVCLDKLLSTVSTRYATKSGYDFINIGDNPTYKYPRHNDRKIYSVFVEYQVPRNRQHGNDRFAPDETDLKWFGETITSRYGFWKVARLDAAHRSRRSFEPAPIWLDTVMFEHMCQEGMGFTRDL